MVATGIAGTDVGILFDVGFLGIDLRDGHGEAELAHPGLHRLQSFEGHGLVVLALGTHVPYGEGQALEAGHGLVALLYQQAVVGTRDCRERMAMDGIGKGCHGLSQHVDLPVRGLATLRQAIEAPRGRPHDIAARLIVLGIDQGLARTDDQRAHEALGQVVARVVVASREILL